jgi:hypothetical protein
MRGHLKAIVYAAPVDNEMALHHRIVDDCQTIRIYLAIFEHILWSMMTRVNMCTEPHGGHLYKCSLPAITHKLNV